MQGRGFGMAAAAGAAILFGSANVAAVFLLRSFTPASGAFWRAVIGAGMLVALALVMDRRVGSEGRLAPAVPPGAAGRPILRDPARFARGALIGLCGGPLFLVFVHSAVAGTGASITGFVSGLYAVFAAAGATVVLGEPLRGRVAGGLGMALAGTALLSRFDPDPRFLGGLLAGLGAAAVYALYLLLGRRWSTRHELAPRTISGFAVGTGLAVLPAWTLLSGAPLVPPSIVPEALAAVAWMALVFVLGQVLVMASVRRTAAATTAALLLLNPISSTGLAMLVLGERLAPVQVLGAALVLAGILLAVGPTPRWR